MATVVRKGALLTKVYETVVSNRVTKWQHNIFENFLSFWYILKMARELFEEEWKKTSTII